MTDDVDMDILVIRSQFAELDRQYHDPRNRGRRQYDILLAMERLSVKYHRRTGQWLERDKPGSKS